MKTNPNHHAFPLQMSHPGWKGEVIFNEGLTKREYFAAIAMQGFVATESMNDTVKWAVMIADMLIEELNKDPNEKTEV